MIARRPKRQALKDIFSHSPEKPVSVGIISQPVVENPHHFVYPKPATDTRNCRKIENALRFRRRSFSIHVKTYSCYRNRQLVTMKK